MFQSVDKKYYAFPNKIFHKSNQNQRLQQQQQQT